VTITTKNRKINFYPREILIVLRYSFKQCRNPQFWPTYKHMCGNYFNG